MKYYEKRTETVTNEYLSKVVCDLCHDTIPPRWMGDVDEVTVERKTGYNGPDGGSGDLVGVDLCPKCFSDRLIPWLESQGANIQRTEWDW